MDKRLSWMVVLYGLLVLALGVLAYVNKRSIPSLVTAGPLGAAITVFGVLTLRTVRWAGRAACVTCAFVAAVLISRSAMTGSLIPNVPVAALGLSLAAVLFQTGRAAT